MLTELYQDLRQLPAITTTTHDLTSDLFFDINRHTVFKVDQDTAMLTDDDMRKYPHLVLEADYREDWATKNFNGVKSLVKASKRN